LQNRPGGKGEREARNRDRGEVATVRASASEFRRTSAILHPIQHFFEFFHLDVCLGFCRLLDGVTEVEDLDEAFAVYCQVRRFQVAVHPVLGVYD
jgi:hypothetical protein